MTKEYVEIKLSALHEGAPIDALIVDVVVEDGKVKTYGVLDMATSQPVDPTICALYRDALNEVALQGYYERKWVMGEA